MTDKNKNRLFKFEIDKQPLVSEYETPSDDVFKSEIKKYISSIEQDDLYQNYSNKQVKKAGRNLRKKQGDLKDAIKIVRSYRADHEGPLDFVFDFVQQITNELNIHFICAKRLKRLETIVNKLQRPSLDGITPNQMCITNMGDIGGCRVICESIVDIQELQKRIKKSIDKNKKLILHRQKNYIEYPKANDCGYRGVHLVIDYIDDNNKKFSIEVQLRTEKQHLWATAVEMVDILEDTQIKTLSHLPVEDKSQNQVAWENMFKIISTLIAYEDDILKLTKEEIAEHKSFLNQLENDINAVTILSSFEILLDNEDTHIKNFNWVVLVIDEINKKVIEKDFIADKRQAAASYSYYENFYPQHNVLLASVHSVIELKKAYPNYLGSSRDFLNILKFWLT